jgi:hypothetical protein
MDRMFGQDIKMHVLIRHETEAGIDRLVDNSRRRTSARP